MRKELGGKLLELVVPGGRGIVVGTVWRGFSAAEVNKVLSTHPGADLVIMLAPVKPDIMGSRCPRLILAQTGLDEAALAIREGRSSFAVVPYLSSERSRALDDSSLFQSRFLLVDANNLESLSVQHPELLSNPVERDAAP